jgi:hypothetical protein
VDVIKANATDFSNVDKPTMIHKVDFVWSVRAKSDVHVLGILNVLVI